MAVFGTISYGLAAAGFFLLALLVAASFVNRKTGGWLLVCTAVTTVWAVGLAYQSTARGLPLSGVFVLEILRLGVWLTFLQRVLVTDSGPPASRLLRFGVPGAWLMALGLGLVQETLRNNGISADGAGKVWLPSGLGLSLIGLLLVEQIYRNSPETSRAAIKYLCIAVGGLFVYDLFLYSQGLLVKEISLELWNARGLIAFLLVPVMVVSIRRNPSWSVDLFVSRHVVFYTSTLIAVGVYLIVMAFAAFYFRAVEYEWGRAAQIVFLFGAGLLLTVILFSGQLRARFKVFVAKHFYTNKYDYRDEWLRLIGTLSGLNHGLPLQERTIKALAQIVGSPGGLLWLRDETDQKYSIVASLDCQLPTCQELADSDPFLVFLSDKQWVVDVQEYRSHPEAYDYVQFPSFLSDPEIFRLAIPLFHGDALLGFVTLRRMTTPFELNYEDIDLLKTAGRQIASFLAQDLASKQLAEGRQFEAYNKLVAFIMHDLKNVLAQQSLVVANADRHRNNPEFIDDALSTVTNSTARMQRLVEQLKHGVPSASASVLRISEVVEKAVASCTDKSPRPIVDEVDPGLRIRCEPSEMIKAVEHLLRNAQEATPTDGQVWVSVLRGGDNVNLTIRDTGCGMDEGFVRRELFSPFRTTKGSKGMGIGAYHAKEIIRAAGGTLKVDTVQGQGTTFTIMLPLVL